MNKIPDVTFELTVFKVADLTCGVINTDVQEINRQLNMTKVCKAPDYVRGVINLRGNIVTIIDLRHKFGFNTIEIQDQMRVVVLRTEDELIGLLVDSVKDTVIAESDEVEPPPSNIDGITGSFFKGIYKMEDSLVGILNIDELLKINHKNS